MKNTISKFQEKEIKNIENINGGKPGEVCIQIKISGVLDGIKKNTDFDIGGCKSSKVRRMPRRYTYARRFSFSRRFSL
jgi:hypothetical protein